MGTRRKRGALDTSRQHRRGCPLGAAGHAAAPAPAHQTARRLACPGSGIGQALQGQSLLLHQLVAGGLHLGGGGGVDGQALQWASGEGAWRLRGAPDWMGEQESMRRWTGPAVGKGGGRGERLVFNLGGRGGVDGQALQLIMIACGSRRASVGPGALVFRCRCMMACTSRRAALDALPSCLLGLPQPDSRGQESPPTPSTAPHTAWHPRQHSPLSDRGGGN